MGTPKMPSHRCIQLFPDRIKEFLVYYMISSYIEGCNYLYMCVIRCTATLIIALIIITTIVVIIRMYE